MPQGLQIWDEAGRIVLDTTDSIARIIEVVYISGPGSFTNSEMTKGNLLLHFIPFDYSQLDFPIFTLSGNTLSWQQDGNKAFGGNLFVGTY